MREEIVAQRHFELSEDFYALTFLSYKKDVAAKYELSSKQQARFFQSCLWVFSF